MKNTTIKTYRPSSCRIGRQGLCQDLTDLRCSLRIDGSHLGGGRNEARRFCALLPNFTRVFQGDSWVKFGSHVCCEKTSRFSPRCQAPTESASWLRAKIKNRSLLTPWPPLLLLLPPPRTPPPAFAARQSQGHHPSYHRTRPDSMHIFSISVFPLSTT